MHTLLGPAWEPGTALGQLSFAAHGGGLGGEVEQVSVLQERPLEAEMSCGGTGGSNLAKLSCFSLMQLCPVCGWG